MHPDIELSFDAIIKMINDLINLVFNVSFRA